MSRSAASVVSALSGIVANGRRTIITFPLPSLKFRTAGFPRYGFKPGSDRDLRRRLYVGLYAILAGPAGPSVDRPSVWAMGTVPSGNLVQRPLAPQRVILSRRIVAYYGLIRGSGALRPISRQRRLYGQYRASKASSQSVPALLCASFQPCRLPYPGGRRVFDCSQSLRCGLRPVCRGSASASFLATGLREGAFSGLQSSLYAAARSVAGPAPVRALTSELSSHESPHWYVRYNYAGRQSIPATGLSPAGHAALQAASKPRHQSVCPPLFPSPCHALAYSHGRSANAKQRHTARSDW